MKIIRTENFVACDFCNEGADSYGGVLVGSGTAVCGNCSEKNEFTHKGIPNQAYEHKDEISEYFDKDKTFQENVEQYRLEKYGTKYATTIITDWDI
tara:strand:+ start:2171 stop:2458 length:288 start_codon:yes stop_codon:yes gene_type:complete